MKKEIVFSSKFDTSNFDAAIAQMQKKLRDLQSGPEMMRAQQATSQRLGGIGMGGSLSAPTMEAYTKATQQSRRELDQLIKEQATGQERLGKMLGQRVDKLKEMKNEYRDLVRLGKEDLELKEKISRVEENNSRLRESYKQRDTTVNQLMDARQNQTPQGIDRLMQAYRGGGVGGVARAGGRMLAQNPIAGIGLAGAAMGGIGGAVALGGEMYGNYANSPLRSQGAAGNAVQSTVGNDLNNIYNKRSAFEAAWNPERSNAARMALAASSGNRVQAGTSLAGNMFGFAGAGVSAGAGIGAGLGSVVPGLGTVAGGLAGGALGGIAGGLKGAYNVFSDPTQRALAMSAIPGSIGKRYGTEYENLQSQQTGADYQKALQDQKNMNPGKVLGSQYYEQNMMTNLNAQRGLGLNDEGLYGNNGVIGSAHRGGFTAEMGVQSSMDILGAGGSSRGAAGLGTLGLQAQRSMGLTNSRQTLGTLSGGMGSADQSREAFIKILSEGTRLGLDDSKFAEENRRFTQTTAELIARSGASSTSDAGRISGNFGKFVTENTNQGIGAAKSAYETYQGISSSTTGRSGTMRAAGFLQNPLLSKLSPIEKDALMKVPEEQLNDTNVLVQNAASKAGVSPQTIVDSIKNTNQNSISSFKEHDVIRDRLRKQGVDVSKLKTAGDFAKLPKSTLEDLGKMASYESAEQGNMGQREQMSFLGGQLGGGVGGGAGREAAVNAKLANGDTGRMGDQTIGDMAKDSATIVNNFRQMKDELLPSAKAVNDLTSGLREMMIVLRTATKEDIPAIIKHYQGKVATQVQAGKVSR